MKKQSTETNLTDNWLAWSKHNIEQCRVCKDNASNTNKDVSEEALQMHSLYNHAHVRGGANLTSSVVDERLKLEKHQHHKTLCSLIKTEERLSQSQSGSRNSEMRYEALQPNILKDLAHGRGLVVLGSTVDVATSPDVQVLQLKNSHVKREPADSETDDTKVLLAHYQQEVDDQISSRRLTSMSSQGFSSHLNDISPSLNYNLDSIYTTEPGSEQSNVQRGYNTLHGNKVSTPELLVVSDEFNEGDEADKNKDTDEAMTELCYEAEQRDVNASDHSKTNNTTPETNEFNARQIRNMNSGNIWYQTPKYQPVVQLKKLPSWTRINVGAAQSMSAKSVTEKQGLSVDHSEGNGQRKGIAALKPRKLKCRTTFANPHTCTICNKTFPVPSALINHIRIHTGEKPFTCNICNRGFSQASSRNKHMLTHSDEKPYTCNICDRNFSQLSYLKSHTLVHTGGRPKPYSCTFCNKDFSSTKGLTYHMHTHTGEKPYRCKVCDKAVSTPSELVSHNRTHTGEKPYTCTVCNKAFTVPSALKTHIRTHTGERPYECNVCSRGFSSASALKAHTVVHSGERRYTCKICNKAFPRREHLKSHNMTHSGEKPYVCKVCNKRFAQSSHLRTHRFVHSGEKPYTCKLCNKSFAQRYALKTHSYTHADQTPYTCNVCHRAFASSSHLKRHTFIHVPGEKPYTCNICNKTFTTKSHLKAHSRTHTGEKLFTCSVCNKGLSTKSCLQAHTLLHVAGKL